MGMGIKGQSVHALALYYLNSFPKGMLEIPARSGLHFYAKLKVQANRLGSHVQYYSSSLAQDHQGNFSLPCHSHSFSVYDLSSSARIFSPLARAESKSPTM